MTDRHQKIVDAILDTPEECLGKGGMAVLQRLGAQFPDMSRDEFYAAMDDAAEEFKARAEQMRREADALDQLAPLFDGMPEGMEIGECARIKAAKGDPLAIAFLKWEVEQAGGVQ